MKTTLKVFAVAMIALFTFGTTMNAQDKKAKATEEVTFSVPIDCPNCKKKLESVLPHEAGVKDLKVDLENQTVWFKYQSDKTNKENLKKAIEKQGYEVKEITPAEKK